LNLTTIVGWLYIRLNKQDLQLNTYACHGFHIAYRVYVVVVVRVA